MPALEFPSTKKNTRLTLIDKLSRLSYQQTIKLLGSDGAKLLRAGDKWDIHIADDVYLGNDLLRLKFPSERGSNGDAAQPVVVTITLMAEAYDRLHWNCTACESLCEHVGAAFSLILDEKMALGLATPPPERMPVESLGEQELIKRAIDERRERARMERMIVKSADADRPWTDYTVTSTISGKTYRVAIRGREPGDSYCSCPDFRTNTLGTCKHILHVLAKLTRRFSAAQLNRPYKRKTIGVHVRYGDQASLRLLLPERLDPEADEVLGKLRDQNIDDIPDLVKRISCLERQGRTVNIYPDAEEFIQQRLLLDRVARCVTEIRRRPESHPLRRDLLKVELLPYQLDGVAFAVGAGRAVVADEMGLGKTIQAIGVAELFAREAGISKVLVICPASLKSQWRNEINRFCHRDCQLITGATASRASQYANECFFTICNYEQVLRDILSIERVNWDLIILDEGQRIKNWEAKTTRVIKGLRSRFALVLSGTPLENRLDELYSVMQFIDDRRLGPAFRFYNRHRVVDEKGKVLGYKNLTELRENLRPILLRRTRQSVRQQLPPRTSEIVRITPTLEQLELHRSHMRLVNRITRKRFLTEMDLLRLQKHLLMCRMSANSTFLVDKERPGYSSKLEELDNLFDRLFSEENRKVLMFSEWTTMLDLIEPLLKKRDLRFVRLDGSVPQKLRHGLVHEFQTDPDCRLFLTTNAGSTGLNLQAANTVINVDLPWNPAVLEQRVARAYRMGQTQPVQVFILITESTIEEKLLSTLSAKHDLFLAALDVESDVDQLDLAGGIEELRRRLEVLLGSRPQAPLDDSLLRQSELEATQSAAAECSEPIASAGSAESNQQAAHATDTARHARREKLATAGGQLLAAAFQFLGELLPPSSSSPATTEATTALASNLKQSLTDLVDRDGQGRPRITFAIPDARLLDNFVDVVARMLAQVQR
jgi:SNF2-related domain/Helicase conserved C-terminal domain